jgi:hypothetical protein
MTDIIRPADVTMTGTAPQARPALAVRPLRGGAAAKARAGERIELAARSREGFGGSLADAVTARSGGRRVLAAAAMSSGGTWWLVARELPRHGTGESCAYYLACAHYWQGRAGWDIWTPAFCEAPVRTLAAAVATLAAGVAGDAA